MKQWIVLAAAFSLLLPALQPSSRAAGAKDESQLIRVLQSDSSPREKDAACSRLKRIGTPRCVPALAALLTDERLSDSARHALESLPGPEAEQALLQALDKTSGATRIGIINSLGVRADPAAVQPLAKLLEAADTGAAAAAATALGQIATPEARDALQANLRRSAGTVHDAVVDACLECANRMLASGRQRQALAAFQELYRTEPKDYVQTAAYRGMIRASGKKELERMAGAITGPPGPARMAALQLVHEVQAPGASEALAALLPRVDPEMQVDLMAGLSQRNDPAAAPAVAALVRSGQPAVRVAAINALGILGGEADVSLLVECAATGAGAEQAAARRALGLLHRGNPDGKLISLMSTARPEFQVEAARAVGERGDAAAVPKLLTLAKQAPDAVRQAALRALSLLVGQPQLEAMVQVVLAATDASSRADAARALDLACLRIQARHGQVDLEPLVTKLQEGDADTRIALLPACSGLADPRLRSALRACVADSNTAVRDAAIHALCNTMDPGLLPDLVKIAREARDESSRMPAIRACVRLATQEEGVKVPNSDRDAIFQELLSVSATADEKRLVLSGLADTPDAAALKLAEPLLADPGVQNEAAWAVIKICHALPEARAGIAALHQVLARTSDAMIQKTAKADLEQLQLHADYITDWQCAGPYREKGKNYSALFDIAFPPETGAGDGAQWRRLPAGADPSQPWLMDLLKAFGGGNNCVAYARTWVQAGQERQALLELGTDDGVKVWLNGRLVHANNVARGLQPGSDKVAVTLNKGWNRLLLKITQFNQGWAFCARLVAPDGSHLDGLRFDASSAEPK